MRYRLCSPCPHTNEGAVREIERHNSQSFEEMPITPTNPFKGCQYPGEPIVLCVRWYLRYPLAYEHVAEIIAERGVSVDASCIWRWVQIYGAELDH
jgi:hypothetical protein